MNEQFLKNNYLYIPNFISKKRALFLASGFKQFAIDNEYGGDNQVENSQSVYHYLPFTRLLVEKIKDVSEIIGEHVLPTYVYARVYKEKAVLKKHTDREACEISLTLNLKQDIEWPIHIRKPSGEEVEITLKPGDAMLYAGCVAEHWRNQFKGKEHIQVFLHYVRSYGDNSWAFFDTLKENNLEYFDEIPVTII